MNKNLHILTGAPGTGKTAILEHLTSSHRYDDDVLILEQWEEIYTTDAERQMTFSQVLSFHRRLEEAYRIAGYTVFPVPVETLNCCGAFVEKFVWHA